MPVLPAALLVVGLAVLYLSRTSTKLPASITLAKPTTVVPVGTVVIAALLVIVVASEAEAEPLWVLGLGAIVGFVIITLGGTTSGSRMIIDRGGLRMPPGKLIGVSLVAGFCFYALIRNG